MANTFDHDFTDPDTLDDPFDAYAEMHESCPVHQMPQTGFYVVAGYEDVRNILTDPSVFSSRPSAGARGASPEALAHQAVFEKDGWVKARTLQRTDPPVHTFYRKMLSRVFSQRRVAEMEPHIAEICHELIDGFIEDGRCEWVEDLAKPLPGIVIAEQLGLSADDIDTFRRWADAMLAMNQRQLTPEEAEAAARIELEAQHFLADEFEKRRENPQDDLITALVEARDENGDPLSMEELQDLMHQLITGGFETTTAALATGMQLLLEYPDQYAKLRADRSLLKNFVEESLRFDSPVAGLWRTTACPATVSGVEIPEGAMVHQRYAAANRDPAVFENPDVFDIERPDVNNHIAFGLGGHFCVGAALARAELRVAFDAVLDRMDDLELAEPLPSPAHEYSFFLRPMKELHISFNAVN